MHRKASRGFTLIEVMVAIAIMAVMGAMSWMALDVLTRTQNASEQHSIATSELQIALHQWSVDLDQARHLAHTEPMSWDGKVFRLTRNSPGAAEGVIVVAWSVRADQSNQMQWMRWHSPVIRTVGAWKQAWEAAALWSRGGALGNAVSLVPATVMDVHVWASNTWVNGLSTSADAESNAQNVSSKAAVKAQPQGVRVILQTNGGALTKDWVSLLFSDAKS